MHRFLLGGAALTIGVVSTAAVALTDDPITTRRALMQANGAVISGVLGLIAAWATRDWRWIVGAMLILANWPYTLLGIMPTNHALKAIAENDAGPQSRALIVKWGGLHAVRTALGIAATLAYLWALN